MVLFVLFFVVVVVVGFVSYFVGQQRIRDIAAFGAAHGLTVIGNEWDLGDCGFALFRAGTRRYWHNVLRGEWNGLPVTYCDYSYVVSDGKNQSTVSFSNVIATIGVQMPQVTVSPRSAIGALAEKSIGAPGIRFESIDFNDRFDVTSSDDAFAVELIDAQMIEALLSLDHGYHVVFGPLCLMVYAHRRPVTEVGGIFDATTLVAQRIPALVRARSGS
ncbi:MAG: DUF3137 domain-containing protein [Candidatus Dormibacteria bacterium]